MGYFIHKMYSWGHQTDKMTQKGGQIQSPVKLYWYMLKVLTCMWSRQATDRKTYHGQDWYALKREPNYICGQLLIILDENTALWGEPNQALHMKMLYMAQYAVSDCNQGRQHSQWESTAHCGLFVTPILAELSVPAFDWKQWSGCNCRRLPSSKCSIWYSFLLIRQKCLLSTLDIYNISFT